jgi:hypothetical protein
VVPASARLTFSHPLQDEKENPSAKALATGSWECDNVNPPWHKSQLVDHGLVDLLPMAFWNKPFVPTSALSKQRL